MFFLILFLAVGGTYVAARSAASPVVLFFIAVYITLSYVLAPLVWFMEHSGLLRFVHESWLFLGGIESAKELYPGCEKVDLNANPIIGFGVPLFGIFLIFVFMGTATLLTFIALPIGLIITAYGSAHYLITKDEDYMMFGLRSFTYGVAGILLGGIGIRVINLFASLELNCV